MKNYQFLLILTLNLTSTLIGLSQSCSEYDMINFRKTAIVFGEKNYQHVAALNNPENDAGDISDSLKKLGFWVFTYYNTDYKTMVAALEDWYEKIGKFDVALFYYSGHGAEVNGVNYLFPIDANPKGISDLNFMAYSANNVLATMESKNSKFNIMILDACRNNSFTKGWGKELNAGLASMTGKGSFIGFAASPGKTASDGDKRNGTYTEAILKYIMTPNQSIYQIFTKVNSYVRTSTSDIQIPYLNSSFSVDFCFSVKSGLKSNGSTKSTFIQPISSILLSPKEETIYVSDSINAGLEWKNSKTMSVFKMAGQGQLHPYRIATRNGDNLYVLDTFEHSLSIVESKSGSAKSIIKLGSKPLSMAITLDESKAYIIDQNSATSKCVSVIDLTKKAAIKQIVVGIVPDNMILSADGKSLYVSSVPNMSKSTLAMLDVKSDKLNKSFENLAAGDAIGISPDRSHLWVSKIQKDSIDQIKVFETGSMKELASIQCKSTSFSFTPDSKYVLAVGESEISIIRVEDYSIVNTLPFATRPAAVTTSDDFRSFVWLPEEHRIFTFPLTDYLAPQMKIDPETTLKKFKDEVQKESVGDLRLRMSLVADSARNSVLSTVYEYKNELGDLFEVGTGVNQTDRINYSFTIAFGFVRKMDATKKLVPIFKGRVSENDLTISIAEDDTSKEESIKAPLFLIDWGKIRKFIRDYYSVRLNRLR